MADRIFRLKFLSDVAGAIRGMSQIEDKLGSMSGGQKAALGTAAAGGAAMGAIAAGGLVAAVKLAANYEHAIDQVAAVAGAGEAETRKLYETGRRIGRETSFTATEAARAMELLASRGVSVADIVSGAADATVALAAAGGVDLALAADTAATSMAVWGLKTKDMEEVVNRLAAGDLVSRFGVEDLSQAIAMGGGAAKTAGVEFADFITTAAAISPSFSSGSDAGTSLKTMFMRLNPQTKGAKLAMKDLGLWTEKTGSAFYDQQGNLKSMAEVTGLLHNAIKDLSEEDRTTALNKIFGTDAFRAASALSAMTREQFESMSGAMGGVDAADVAAQRLGNLNGALDRLKGSMEDIGISLGEKLLPPLTVLADWLATTLPKVPTWAFVAVGGFMLLVGGLSAVGLALIPIITLMGPLGLGGAALSLGPLVAAAFPFLLVAAAVASIIASGVLLFGHWEEVKTKARGVREAILSTVGLSGNAQARAGLSGAGKGLTMALPFGVVRNAIDAVGEIGGWFGGGDDSRIGGLSPEGYATGGVVPGPLGSPRLAVVHGGEEVLTPGQRGGGAVYITLNVPGLIGNEIELQKVLLEGLTLARQRGAWA